MKIKISLIATVIAIGITSFLVYWFLSTHNVSLLQPKGEIAQKQFELLRFASLLSLVVIVPVYIMLIGFAWRYRATNKKATYKPNWDSNKKAEAVWWGIPIALILVLSVITWQSSHSLDPYKPLDSAKKPLAVQVVALQWKWLFIYPQYGIATVNSLTIPEQTPVDFYITADAPMNSFWIPDLGGQIYAMAGMETELHLQADSTGNYPGYSANISGEGFADMKFNVESVSDYSFNTWLQSTSLKEEALAMDAYHTLAQPSIMESPMYYGRVDDTLFMDIMNSYMHNHSDNTKTESHMDHGDHSMEDM